MNDMNMNDIALLVLIIVIIIFVIALIVFVVHLVTTVRKVNKTIDDIQPTIDTANQMLEDLQPALKRIDPLVERVSLTVDAVNLEIMRADTILADISEITSTATDTVDKVAEITDAPINLLNAATDKVRNLFGSNKEKRKAEKVVRRSAEKQTTEVSSEEETPAEPETDSAPLETESILESEAPSADESVFEAAQENNEAYMAQEAAPLVDLSYAERSSEEIPFNEEQKSNDLTSTVEATPEEREPAFIQEASVESASEYVPEPVFADSESALTKEQPAPPTTEPIFRTKPEATVEQPAPSVAESAVQQNVVSAAASFNEYAASKEPQFNTQHQVNYTPDFEPDDDLSEPTPQEAQDESEGFLLFYTDEEGIQEGKRSN